MASRQVYFRAAALLGGFVVSTALILGFFGRFHPALDSLAHFRAHLSVALAICALVLMAARLRMNALAAALLAISALATTLPDSALQFPTAQAALSPETGGQVYRLLQFNLRWNHPDPERVLKLIEDEQPDIVTLDEVSPMWLRKLARLEAAYPYRVICDTGNNGSVILSRWPFAASSQEPCLDRGALATATVDLDGRPVDIGSIHLSWPWPRAQARQIDRLADRVAALGETAILAGDFNATTWSAAVRRVAETGKLTIVNRVGPTWIHYAFPRSMRWAGLPIDHVMVKGDVVPQGMRTLDDAGSDHWPVLMEFSLRPQRAAI